MVKTVHPLIRPKKICKRTVAVLHCRDHGRAFDVTHSGELLVEGSGDPECDLARVLVARGITGRVTMLDSATGKPRSIVNIEKAARVRVEEGPYGPRFVRHVTVVDRGSSPETAPRIVRSPPQRTQLHGEAPHEWEGEPCMS